MECEFGYTVFSISWTKDLNREPAGGENVEETVDEKVSRSVVILYDIQRGEVEEPATP